MKKSLVYSLILHVLALLLAFSLVKEEREKEPPPFFAEIITPEELQQKRLGHPKIPPLPKKDKTFRMPKLPKDIPSPEEFSAVSSQSKVEQMPQKPSADTDSEQKGDNASTDTSSMDSGFSKNEKGMNKQGASEGPPSQSFRERLFDKDVIGKLAQKNKENTKPESGITFDIKGFKYYGYMQRLKEKIEGIWRYPSDAAEKGIYGDLYIRFTIKKDGKLGAVELIRTSGHKILDDAAIKALKDAEPYWPLPEEWGRDGFTITGHFVYSIYGAYIR